MLKNGYYLTLSLYSAEMLESYDSTFYTLFQNVKIYS